MILALIFIKIEDLSNTIDLLSDKLSDDVLSLLEEHYIGWVISKKRKLANFLSGIYIIHKYVVIKD